MHPGVVAHDGQAIDARDVVATVKATLDPAASVVDLARVNWLAGAEAGRQRNGAPKDEGAVRALAGIPDHPADPPARGLGQARLEGLARAPVGAGPYKITEIQPGRSLVLQRFDKYFGAAKGQPSVERITFRRIPDAETQLAELHPRGEPRLHLAPEPGPGRAAEATPGLKIATGGRRSASATSRSDPPDAPAATTRSPNSTFTRRRHPRDQPRKPRAEPRRRGRRGDRHAVPPQAVRLRHQAGRPLRLRPGQSQSPARVGPGTGRLRREDLERRLATGPGPRRSSATCERSASAPS